jgi:PIN domain nuclease of toxin-antitoxin system
LKILLDTHCWLWLCVDPERFSTKTMARLTDPGTQRLLSAASVWEIVIKSRLGKLALPVHPRDFVPSRLEITQTSVLDIALPHMLRVADLPDHHRDPFDRVIIAQAVVENIPLLTADRLFSKYAVELLKP